MRHSDANPSPGPDAPTPYQRLGGDAGMLLILQEFYDRLYADLMVGFFFHPHDKQRLIQSQLHFMARALGGPDRYQGPPIRAVHAALPIQAGHFHRRHQILRDTLRDLKVDEAAAAAWLELDRRLVPSVMPKPKPPATPP
jgi:hemoglobin